MLPRIAAVADWLATRFGFLAANLPMLFGPYEKRGDLAYGTDPQHRLDVYLPSGPAAAPRPVVVFWHGGRWKFGDKADYRFVAAALTQLGCIAILPNYRHYPQVKMQGFMSDAAQAALWAQARAGDFGGDGDGIYLMGHSAGAHMAALLALDASYFAAADKSGPRIVGVIGLSGAYDFLPLTDADDQEIFGPPQNYPGSQPINFVRADAPAMLLVHGLKDTTAWPKNSSNLAAALTACGVPTTLRLYPKVSHANTVAALALLARSRAPTLSDIRDFVVRS